MFEGICSNKTSTRVIVNAPDYIELLLIIFSLQKYNYFDVIDITLWSDVTITLKKLDESIFVIKGKHECILCRMTD